MKVFITDDDMCTTQKLNLARVQKWIEANGGSVTIDREEADKLLCMTCNGWSLLEQASYDRISQYSENYSDRMVVVGCVNDAHPDEVAKIWSGPTVNTAGDSAYSFAGIEVEFPEFKIPISDVPAQSIFRRKEDYRDYNTSKRFINIAEGCSFSCTFCTHKPGLGNRRSRPLEEIMSQISECVRDGVKIVNLMGMETSLYGIDVGSNYPELMQTVLDFDDSYEVHVAQFQPTGVYRYYDKLLPLLQNKRVTDIQIPIQSTSPRIMKMMNRREHSSQLGPFMKELRRVNTRAITRTDLIIGWPTETAEERKATLDFAGDHFDEIALYSIEMSSDLPAWKYRDDAFSGDELEEIRLSSVKYLNKNFNIVVHSGQQDDASMAAAEIKRMMLREKRSVA
jgi:tRNA A37 methylthiotransferase MiaB